MSGLRVKVCGITRREDALRAAALGADLLGINFVPGSPRRIDPRDAREICAGLPPTVSKVGVFAGEEAEAVNDLAESLSLDAVQLHGAEDEAYCRRMRRPVILAVRVGDAGDLEAAAGRKPAFFLLDAKAPDLLGGTGRAFPWELARDFCRAHRVFVAGGLGPDNVAEAVRLLRPYGVDAASRLESAPGRKDPALVERFILAARRAAAGDSGGCDHVD